MIYSVCELAFVARPWLACVAVAAVVLPALAFYKLFLEGVVPQGVAWAGLNSWSPCPRLQSALFHTVPNLHTTLIREYEKDRPFLVSSFANGPNVMLTSKHIRWHNLQLNRGTINFGQLQKQKLHMEYANGIGTDVDADQYLNLLHRVLTRNHLTELDEIHDEVLHVLHKALSGPPNEQCKSINCFELIERCITGSINRILVGKPACRDDDFILATRVVSKAMFPQGLLIQATPALLRPLVGRLYQRLSSRYWLRMLHHVSKPLQSLLESRDPEATASPATAHSPSIVTRFIEEALKTPKTSSSLLTPYALETLVGIVNVAAVSATSLACSDILINILSYPNSASLLAAIRAEAQTLFSAPSGITPALLDAMPITDSVIRESLRLDNGDTFFVQGIVMPSSGLTTPENIFLPKGTRVALPTYALHRDAKIQDSHLSSVSQTDLSDFDPYRYSRMDPEEKQDLAHTVSDHYLAFSLGPHACPGRWLGVAQIKIVLCALFRDFDAEIKGGRAPRKWKLGGYSVPPLFTTLEIKRRG